MSTYGVGHISRTDFARHIQIVADVRAGVESGLLDLYSMVEASRYLFWRATHNKDESNDLVHETYVIVLEQIRSGCLRQADRLVGFIVTISQRQSARWIGNQTERRRRFVSDQDLRFEDFKDGGPIGDQECIDNELRALVQSVIQELPELYRKVTQMAIADVSAVEIQRILGLTGTQFRLRKSRARAMIRSNYNKLIGKVTIVEPPNLRLGGQAYAEFMRKISKPMLIAYPDLPVDHRKAWQHLADESGAFEQYGCYFPRFKDGN